MKKNQRSGHNSINIQSENITVGGITYSEVKEIAMDVFKSNFIELSKDAFVIAEERVRELVDNYLKKLQEENTELTISAKDPDLQYDLFQAQSGYARNGSKYLLNILTEILVDKTKASSVESLLKIILSEAITTVGKLTEQQLNSISVIFLVRYLLHRRPRTMEDLLELIKTYLIPLFDDFPMEQTSALHLQYTGCAHRDMGKERLEQLFRMNYEGLFRIPIDWPKMDEIEFMHPGARKVFTGIPRKNDLSMFTLDMLDQKEFFALCEAEGIHPEKAKSIYKSTELQDPNDVKQSVIEKIPDAIDVFEKWNRSSVGSLRLTTVGIAIGQANLKSKFNMGFELQKWLYL